jgi:hypothetical protein
VAVAEAEVSLGRQGEYRETARAAARKRVIFEQRFQFENLPDFFDFSKITSAQLDEHLKRLLDERAARLEFLAYLGICHRGATAMLKGERNIEKIREQEMPKEQSH